MFAEKFGDFIWNIVNEKVSISRRHNNTYSSQEKIAENSKNPRIKVLTAIKLSKITLEHGWFYKIVFEAMFGYFILYFME